MANRLQIEPRSFTLPDLSNDSRSSSPLTMPRAGPNKSEGNQFVLPAQAFVPIKDSFSASQRDAKRKEMDAIVHQQTKMQEKLRELEAANRHLAAELNSLKKTRDHQPALAGQTEHALRNATDMTLYLTKKLQDMHESITKLEVRLQQQERTIQEEKGGLAALADKVVEVEAGSMINFDDKFAKHSNELNGLRESLQDLRKRLGDEQMERKATEQKLIERLNKQRDDSTSIRQSHHVPPLTPLQASLGAKLEERMVRLEDEMRAKNHKELKPLRDHGPDVEKIKEEIENLKRQLEVADSKKADSKKWAELNRQLGEELASLHQSLKTEKQKTNQEFKSVKDSISLLEEKQVDQHKSLQEKLQAEILTRQQLECDTLRQMTILDDKLIKIGSSFNLPNMKGINSGKSELLIKEVESLKKLIVHTEKNLELKIDDSMSKLTPTRPAQVDQPESVKRQDLEELERSLASRIERCRELPERNLKALESLEDWRGVAERNIRDLRRDVDGLKTEGPRAIPVPAARKDNDLIVELNKRVLRLDESVDDYKVFKEVTNDAVEDLRRRMKSLKSPPKTSGVKDDERELDSERKNQVNAHLDELQKNIKANKEKLLLHDTRLDSLKKDVDSETSDRISDIEEVRELIKKGGNNQQPPSSAPEEPRSNSAKEGLKKLANALQGTKNLLALKMQHEMKERENAVGYLTKRVDDLDSTVEVMDDRLHKLEDKSDSRDDDEKRNPQDGESPKRAKKENEPPKSQSDKDGGTPKAKKPKKKDP